MILVYSFLFIWPEMKPYWKDFTDRKKNRQKFMKKFS